MESLQYNNYNMDEGKPIFTTANDNQTTTTTDSFAPSDNRSSGAGQDSPFSPLAAPFHSRVGSDVFSLMSQEPRVADTAPSVASEIDDVLMNLRINGSNALFDDIDNNNNFYNMGGNNRADPVAQSHPNIWSEGSTSSVKNGEMIDNFDFLIKSLSSANNYVSMLTREQLSVLRCIRPSLLYEFLLEVAKVRSDKMMRRALPNECAFCKNNGENEESYSSHALKDWRGRVLCPVLRAFRCPRCGATGDHAHTIKYCRDNADAGFERSGSLLSRRRMASSASLVIGGARAGPCGAPATPAPSPSPSAQRNHSSLWYQCYDQSA